MATTDRNSDSFISLAQIIVGLVTFITVRIIIFFYNRRKLYQTFKLLDIPSPKTSLLSGNLNEWVKDGSHLHIVQGWAKQYGKIFGFYLGSIPVLVLTDRTMIRKFLFNHQDIFVNRCGPFIDLEPMQSSLLFCRGNTWRSMRKTLAPAFSAFHFKGQEGTKFIDDSVDLLSKYLNKKYHRCKSTNEAFLVDIHSLMKATTLHLISTMALDFKGVSIKEHDPYVEMLDKFLELSDDAICHWAARLPVIKSTLSYVANRVSFGKFQADILKQLNMKMDNLKNCDTSKSHNVFEEMVQLHKEGKLTRTEVLGNCMAFLVAGYDTTATTLSYFFWSIAKYQDIQDKLRKDIVLNGYESEYLRMVLNETMRLYPALIQFTQREASQDITLDGFTINKGVVVMMNSWLIHRDPDYWADPLRFDPERFTNMSKIDPCTYIPFGITQRFCLGYQLALLELRIVASDLLMEYKFELVSPSELELAMSAQVLSKPTEPIILKLSRLD